MLRLSIFYTLIILFFSSIMIPCSIAITFSFDEYTGAIAEQYTDMSSDPNEVYSTGFSSMNGVPFTEEDIDSSLGTNIQIEIDGDFIDKIETFRGHRVFQPGVSQIDFSTSMLQFSAAENSEYAIGEEFLLGTLTFTNGSWLIDPMGAAFSFTITASSSAAGLTNQEFSGTLRLHTNSNGLPTAEERADWFYIEEKPEFGSVRVYENNGYLIDGDNIGSIDIWGAFGSLDLVGLQNPSGGAFLNDSMTSELTPPVPEPSTILLFGLGILSFAGVSRRK